MENEQESRPASGAPQPTTQDQEDAPVDQEEEEPHEEEQDAPSARESTTTAIAPPPKQSAPTPEAAPTAGIIYENTYKTKPDTKFSSPSVKRAVDDLLALKLKGVKYDAETTPELTRCLADEILQVVKGFNVERYKYVVDVTIGEYKGQGVRIASRCVWDTSTDSYSSSSFRNVSFVLL
jgi:hypothetical protein